VGYRAVLSTLVGCSWEIFFCRVLLVEYTLGFLLENIGLFWWDIGLFWCDIVGCYVESLFDCIQVSLNRIPSLRACVMQNLFVCMCVYLCVHACMCACVGVCS